MIRHEINRVFTFCDRTHKFDQYPFTWKTMAKGIPMAITDWCMDNCRHDWGWWFGSDMIGTIGFMDREEMIHAMLLHADLFDDREINPA